MKKINLTLGLLLGTFSFVSAQVGINTPSPVSTLDITAKNATGKSTNVDGLLVPRVDRERAQNMAGVQTSTIIYINNPVSGTQAGTAANIDAAGYYYFNGTVWTKLNSNNSSSVNIYNSDGTLTGNRIVTQADKTLAFTGTANNAFSVDSKTFSVDAANHRVGIGTTTPENTFHVVNTTPLLNRFSLMDAPESTTQYPIFTLRNTSPLATGNYSLLGFTNSGTASGGANWGIGSIRTGNTIATGQQEEFFIGNSVGANYVERFRIASGGNVGINTPTPQKTMHVNGSLQVTNELNVGGDAATAGSAGTTGQVLTSAGAGAAPTWQAIPAAAASVNIYNADGTLTGNRVVTQGANTLAFNGTATNAFSVDGTSLSVDAANHRVGIGTTAPTNPLDVAGTVRVRTLTPAAGSTVVTPVYSDANGVLVKASPSMTYGGVTSNTINGVTSGATATLYNNLAVGFYKAAIITGNACADGAVAEFYINNQTQYVSVGGDNGFRSSSFGRPTFEQTVYSTVKVTWGGVVGIGCSADGTNVGTAFNYTVSTPSTGTINITNNGDNTRRYQITLTRLD